LRTRDGHGHDPFMIGNGRPDNPDAAGVLGLHFGQAPGLRGWLSRNRGSGGGQPGVPGLSTPDLDPDHHQTPGRAGRAPGDLEQPLAEAEHQPEIVRRAELPADGQAQQVTVEAAAAVQVTGEFPFTSNLDPPCGGGLRRSAG